MKFDRSKALQIDNTCSLEIYISSPEKKFFMFTLEHNVLTLIFCQFITQSVADTLLPSMLRRSLLCVFNPRKIS